MKSPALDVPPEPPNKRQKLSPVKDKPIVPTPKDLLAPPTDTASALDAAERAKYIKGHKLGSGQYADVYSATLVSDPSKLFAIKKIKIGAEAADFGISYDSLREIKFLQELSHPNIIKLHAVFSTKNQNLNLVLEHLPRGDLLKLIQDSSIRYTASDIKAWMLMLSRAVYFIHGNHILHRDIKPNNLLIAADGSIKLADFGLARSFADPYQLMTYNTITTWYRPPELFYQAQYYSGTVDVWSCGCVFAELISRDVLFRAIPETEINMLSLISAKVGTPTEANWPGVSKLRGYIPNDPPAPLRPFNAWLQDFRSAGREGVQLLMAMLTLDPRKRVTAEGVLKHEYWTSEPRPSRLEDLPQKGGGAAVMGEDLGKKPGGTDGRDGAGRAAERDKVARKIDFGAMAPAA